jgi:hypothetical protein
MYKGASALSTSTHTPRPDVTKIYGHQNTNWGFKVCAILDHGDVKHDDVALLFGNGELIRSPGSTFVSDENSRFSDMTRHLLAQSRPGDRVLEIGSRARSGNTNRHLVHPDIEYVGLDITAGPNVTVVGDAHHLSRHVTGEFDAVFSVSVFEHLVMPWMVALEMNKVLKDGGLAYIQSHQTWPLHDEPWDFWRFSGNAWAGLFNSHTGFEVLDSGQCLRAWIAPECSAMPHLQPGMDGGHIYLASACLVQKTTPARVQWDAEAAEVYALGYDHGKTSITT